VSFVVKHGIENNEEFAHAGDERGLGVLTIATARYPLSGAVSEHRCC
jgi:hypothetical protein